MSSAFLLLMLLKFLLSRCRVLSIVVVVFDEAALEIVIPVDKDVAVVDTVEVVVTFVTVVVFS